MLTRGRAANHIYLSVVGDGDPHNVIRPDTVHPRTATELLEQILARDSAAQSATTIHGVHGLYYSIGPFRGPTFYLNRDRLRPCGYVDGVWCVMGLSPRRSLHYLEVARDAASAVAAGGRLTPS
jgi:hypothetical protein